MGSRDPGWKPSVPNPFDPTAFNSPIYGDMSGGHASSRTSLSLSISGLEMSPQGVPNPFDSVPEYKRRVDAPSLTGTFVRGVGSGFLHPIRAVVGREEEVEPPDGWGFGHTVADFAGEMAGIGVSFIPFLKGAQVGLKAIGLGRTAAGAFARTPGFMLAEGVVSGAAFEVGSDTADDLGTRLAIGAGMGLAAEAGLLAVGRAWRGKWAGTQASPTATGTALVPVRSIRRVDPLNIDAAINPVALDLERNILPDGAKTLEEAMGRLRAIGDHGDQLQDAAARVIQQFQPYGFGILRGIQNPGQTMRALKKQYGNDLMLALHVPAPRAPEVTRIGGRAWEQTVDEKPMYEILMLDRKGRDSIEMTGHSVQFIKEVFMGKGESPDFKRVLEILEGPAGIEPLVPIRVVSDAQLQQEWRASGGRGQVAGFAGPHSGIAVTREGFSEQEAIATLVHEYAHHLTFWSATRHTGSVGPPNQVQTLTNVLFEGVDPDFSRMAKVRMEMEELSIQALQYQNNMTKENARGRFVGDYNYYGSDREMISRAVEVMFLNPDLARQLAPEATQLMADHILRHSPKMKMVLTKKELQHMQMILEGMWKKSDTGETSIFRRLVRDVDDGAAADFEKYGFFRGMNVFFEGDEWVVQNLPKGYMNGKLLIKNPMTGASRSLSPNEVHRPMMQRIVTRNKEVVEKVQKMAREPAEWLGVVLREAPVLDEAATAAHPKGREVFRWAVRKAVVNLKNFARSSGAAAFLRENKEIHERALEVLKDRAGGWSGMAVKQEAIDNGFLRLTKEQQLDAIKSNFDDILRDLTPDDVMREMALLKGVDGVVFNDDGRHLLFIANREAAISPATEVTSHRWVNSVDGEMDKPWITPSQENVMESLLREAGVGDRELEYFKRINPFEGVVREVAEEQQLLGRMLKGRAEAAAAAIEEPIEVAASRAGFRVDRTTDGEYRLLTDSNEVAAISPSEAAVRDYVARVGPDPNMPDLELEAAIKPSALPQAAPHSVRPIRPFEQPAPDKRPGFMERMLDATQLFLSHFTAMENIAKSGERNGAGPLFTKIFHPVQEALVRVDNQLAGIKRDAFGGRTFSEQLKLIESLAEGPIFGKKFKERQEFAIRAIEAASKEEIARAGGLMKRAMTREEIALADTFSGLGLEHDIPRITGTLRMARSAVANKTAFPKKLADMARVEVNPEFRAALDQMTAQLDDMPDTVEGILRMLGYSEAEMTAAGIIDSILTKGVDTQSLFAISRYAAAKPLTKGYKSAREEFMAVNKFDAKERQLVEELEKTYKAAFAISNLSSSKELSGYWPHMRKWIENGTFPEEEFIRKHIPESVEWSAERVRTGELDVYLMDPTLVTAKYVRSMLMKQEFDPILPEVKAALANVEARDARLHGIFTEYVHEATGRPHASFRNLHKMISKSSEILLGRTPDERFTRDFINTVGSLANAAAIPFRPMLIARNYFQMAQMIPPRTGVTEFFDGLTMAMSDEGFKEAVEKGIVTKNVLPVHAATELYGYDTSKLNRRMQRIFAKGFEWYQKPDDIGRAASFFAAKARISRNMSARIKGTISHEEFKSRSKINTYDPVDIQHFDDLWAAGRYEEAGDYIGSRLARETIFRYGHANHPQGWGSVAGRLYGTFGTWPTQYKDFLMQGISRGSTRDRAEFLAIHGTVNAATLAAGAAVGVDLMSWVSYPSLNYTGGPMADLTVNVIQAFGGSPTEQSLAKRNIRTMFPSLDDPRSIFVPGSYFIGDLHKAMTAQTTEDAVIGGLGIRMLHKGSQNPMAGFWD